MQGYTIRRAQESDTEDILKLLVQVDMVHHKGRPDIFKGPATKYTARELKALYQDDSRPIFVSIDKDGHVAGYAFCIFQETEDNNNMVGHKTLYIDDLCVDENVRGCHIGSSLYKYVKDFAKKGGCYNLTLNVWECNPTAKIFYEHMGLLPQKTYMEAVLA